MASIPEQRIYNFLDATLCQYTSDLCNILTRDAVDLGLFGITAPQITALKALGDAFEVFPPDDALLGDLMVATETKNGLADQVRETIRNMALRVQIKWGTGSGQYKSLGDMGLSKLIEDVLLTTARNVHTRMTGFLTDLASTGLTQDLLDDFEDLNNSFEDSRNEVANKVEERDLKTRERIANGNALYSLVVNYCEIGKRIYEKTNAAKYNDYIIYGSAEPGSLTVPTGLSYNISENLFAWSQVTNATSYQLERSSDGITYEEYYARGETRFNIQPEGNTEYYYRCRARNSGGYGPYSEVYRFTYWTALPPPLNGTAVWSTENPTQVTISCENVAGSDFYSICKSVVPPGAEAGAWIYLPNSINPEWVISAERNKRMYFRINGATSYLVGTQSSPFFVEVG